jgi:hypothetical protein
MTALASGDVRGFYEALGVELPGWARDEAPAHCFASPDSHKHDDRSPSTSVNLTNGAWCCHGCGAAGGAYDAALAIGHTPRSAIELMIRHGLIERRTEPLAGRTTERSPSANRDASSIRIDPRQSGAHVTTHRVLAASDDDVRQWAASLKRRPSLIDQLAIERGWRFGIMRQLEIGLDAAGRVTIPIRDRDNGLRGVLRYHPMRCRGPKMLAVRGTRLGLIPHPARERSPHVVLAEGPADMIAARSSGIPAIAVPGTHAWRSDWAELLRGRRVTILMDCDAPGREAAQRIKGDLDGRCRVEILDLDPGRDDGYDLTDALLDDVHAPTAPARLAHLHRALERRPLDREPGVER